jgi:hypothetical protein
VRNRWVVLGVLLLVGSLFAAVADPDQALTWSRIGRGGLDGPYNSAQYGVDCACLFNGKLHFGTGGGWSSGGQIWSYDGHKWVMVHKPKAGKPHISGVDTLAVLGNYLYAGMEVNNGTCEVWRTDGKGKGLYRWTKVSGTADIGQQFTIAVSSMAVLKGNLYCGTWNNYYGCRVWKYDGSAWTPVVGQGAAGSPTGPGFGNKDNFAATSMVSSASGELYVGTGRNNGGEVWRLSGSSWTQLNKPGFGITKNYSVNVLIFFKNSLYAGTENYSAGAQVWKYIGPGPANWKAVGRNGLGDPNNRSVTSAAVFGSPARLYFITNNGLRGSQVLGTDGTKWQKVSKNGMGEGVTNWLGGCLTVFGGKLYAGVAGDFGSRVYATEGGTKAPFAWTLVNDSGFSTNSTEAVSSSAFFGGKLYVGTSSPLGCQVWRYEGNAWTQVASGGFGDAYNWVAESMAVANGYLYVGTNNYITGAEVWRFDGSKWTQANKNGFGDKDSENARVMIVHQGKLYVGMESWKHKAKVWRCDGPKTTQWTQVNTNGFGMSTTTGIRAFAVFNNKLYAGTDDTNDPCHVWRYDGGGPSSWTLVSVAGFGRNERHAVDSMGVYKNALYAGVWNAAMTGCEIWKYSGSGTSWSQVNVKGFGTANNSSPDAMAVFNNLLYVGTGNGINGGEIWSFDGSTWSRVAKSGFGTNNNVEILTFASDGKDLFAGTFNSVTGAEVWTTGKGSSNPLIFRASPFPSSSGAFRGQPGKSSRPESPGRTR